MSVLLITVSDFQGIRDIPPSVDVNKLNKFIDEAQRYDLRPVLGDSMHFDFLKNYNDSTFTNYANYQALLNGKEYTDPQNYLIQYAGMKRALVYWTYARFIKNLNTAVTAYGLTQKKSPYGDQTSDKDKANAITDANNCADAERVGIVKFLNDQNALISSTFPLWKQSVLSYKTTGGIKISAVGGNSSPSYNPYPRNRCTCGYGPWCNGYCNNYNNP